jgi:uncharacterized membrane protein YeaQ/YmgE (transglycosylase-associated protein family)
MLHVFGHMLFGLVVGIVAKLLMPGQHPGGVIATMLLGIVGAWLGGVIGRALKIYPPGHPAGFLMALIGASIVLLIYGYFTGPQPIRVRSERTVIVATG